MDDRTRTLLRRAFLATTVLLVAVVGVVIARSFAEPRPELTGTPIQPPMPAADFTLTGADGPVSLSDFRGRTVVLFFGYTSCPDVCPMTLARLAQARERLGPAAEDVQVVMVSVDPARDTPGRVSAYARGFDPSFVGLTGSPEEVAAVARDFGIYSGRSAGGAPAAAGAAPDGEAREPADAAGAGDRYLVDHSATVTALGPDGRVRMLWPFDVGPEAFATDLAWLVGA